MYLGMRNGTGALILSLLVKERKHLFYFGLKKPAAGKSIETYHRLVWSMLNVQILHLIIAKRLALKIPHALPLWQFAKP